MAAHTDTRLFEEARLLQELLLLPDLQSAQSSHGQAATFFPAPALPTFARPSCCSQAGDTPPHGSPDRATTVAGTHVCRVDPADRRRLDFVAYGATPLGEALCCDVTLVFSLMREERPQPSAASRDGAALAVAERRTCAAYPELLRPGPATLRSRLRVRRAGVPSPSASLRRCTMQALRLRTS